MKITEPYTIFPRKLNSGKTVYYYQFRLPDGTRSNAKSTGCTTEASAKRFCNRLYNAGEFTQTSSTKFSVYSKDFFTESSDWYKWKLVNNKKPSPETLLAYNKVLNNQILPFFENYQLQAITRDTVKKWIIWANEQWSAKTVNNAQTALNILLNTAVEKNLIQFNPANNLGFRKVKKIDRDLFTTEELHKMYTEGHWSYETIRTAFLLCCITGMRINEISCLTTSDIHDDYILVSRNYSRTFGVGETTKGKQSRIVPIPTDFPFPEPNQDGFLFVNLKKIKPINCSTVYDNIFRVGDEVGINCKERKLTTHALRDFYNTYLESVNITDAKIKAVIGHKDPTMTGHYTYWKPDMFPEVHKVQDILYKQIIGETK